LLYIQDGGHWIPIGGKLWRDDYKLSKHIHAMFSSSLCAGFLYYIYSACGNWYDFMIYYGGSWCVFAWWIITVTYLQHHDNHVEDTKIYGDDTWTYLKGALQTVDRKYGFMIDDLSHNITDCHIIHHIFFSKIPHYNLKKATKHLYMFLDSRGIQYKCQNSPFFFFDILRLTFSNLNEGTLVKKDL
jgi:omega-3 fatty acid desaturase (delta-15 desaturase)